MMDLQQVVSDIADGQKDIHSAGSKFKDFRPVC
jgi:hypothetical protein